MADDNLFSLVGGGLGGATGIAVLGKYVWDSVKGRKDQLEAAHEENRDRKLDEVLAKLSKVESSISVIEANLAHSDGSMTELRNRIDGISNNYGTRMTELEKQVAGLEARKRR